MFKDKTYSKPYNFNSDPQGKYNLAFEQTDTAQNRIDTPSKIMTDTKDLIYLPQNTYQRKLQNYRPYHHPRLIGTRRVKWIAAIPLALIYLKQDQEKLAQEYFEQSLTVHQKRLAENLHGGEEQIRYLGTPSPPDLIPKLYHFLGLLAYSQNDLIRAQHHFKQSITEAKNRQITNYQQKSYAYLGAIYTSQNLTEQAIDAYRQSILLGPPSTQILSNFGVILSATNQYDEAISIFKQAIELSPEDSRYWLNLSTTHYQSGQYEKARQTAQSAISANPQEADAYTNLGLANEQLNRIEAARVAYQKAIDLNPTDEVSKQRLEYLQITSR